MCEAPNVEMANVTNEEKVSWHHRGEAYQPAMRTKHLPLDYDSQHRQTSKES